MSSKSGELHSMDVVIIYANAAFFLLMGIVALLNPTRVTSTFKVSLITSDMRNEVRAVYGGFGIAMAVLLNLAARMAAHNQPMSHGIVFAIAFAAIGMAFGRILSYCFERDLGKYPYIFFGVEILIGSSLLFTIYG